MYALVCSGFLERMMLSSNNAVSDAKAPLEGLDKRDRSGQMGVRVLLHERVHSLLGEEG
jgi:hypothetical protein